MCVLHIISFYTSQARRPTNPPRLGYACRRGMYEESVLWDGMREVLRGGGELTGGRLTVGRVRRQELGGKDTRVFAFRRLPSTWSPRYDRNLPIHPVRVYPGGGSSPTRPRSARRGPTPPQTRQKRQGPKRNASRGQEYRPRRWSSKSVPPPRTRIQTRRALNTRAPTTTSRL